MTLVSAPHTGSKPASNVSSLSRGVIAIDAHARRGDAEHDRGAAIEERVERDQDVLGLVAVVAAAERRLDARRPC